MRFRDPSYISFANISVQLTTILFARVCIMKGTLIYTNKQRNAVSKRLLSWQMSLFCVVSYEALSGWERLAIQHSKFDRKIFSYRLLMKPPDIEKSFECQISQNVLISFFFSHKELVSMLSFSDRKRTVCLRGWKLVFAANTLHCVLRIKWKLLSGVFRCSNINRNIWQLTSVMNTTVFLYR